MPAKRRRSYFIALRGFFVFRLCVWPLSFFFRSSLFSSLRLCHLSFFVVSFFAFLLSCFLARFLLSYLTTTTIIIIIYNILISFVRVHAHTCEEHGKTRHKKRSAFWHSLLSCIYISNVESGTILMPDVCRA